MNRTTLPIHEITLGERQRTDLGEIDDLASSLRTLGLIQPIVINQNKRVIAGGRRLAAAKTLGWTHIDVVYRETMSEDELKILELEENIQRKDETWVERCLSIAAIHYLKVNRAAIDCHQWGQRETGAMLGLEGAHINYMLKLARAIKENPDGEVAKAASASDAYKVLMRQQEDAAMAELARRQQEATAKALADQFTFDEEPTTPLPPSLEVLKSKPYISLTKDEARQLYEANPLNPPDDFEQYYSEKLTRYKNYNNTIWISKMLVLGDSIAYMNDPANAGRFDHIITDIPYGIDMDNLSQENTGMDVSTVEAEHDVEANRQLIADFFPAAYRCTKDKAFVVTWCDIMLWQYMYACAVQAGFAVQRWPITWVKTHSCMNQAAQYNYTKSTEIAIICRKPGATLVTTATTCVITASNEEMKTKLGHPFAKPFECWEFIARHVSLAGQTILEPFAGRGSGVLSLLQLERNVVGVELNTAHYNALMENVKQHFLTLNPEFTFK